MEEREPEAEPISPEDLAVLAAVARALGWLHWETNGTSDWDGPPGVTYWADWGDPFLSVYRDGAEDASDYWNPLASMDDAMALLDGYAYELHRSEAGAPLVRCAIWRRGPAGLVTGSGQAETPQRAICIALLRASGS